jgi:hypothetical protein
LPQQNIQADAEEEVQMPYWRSLLGFGFSIVLGDLFVRPLVRQMWAYLSRQGNVPAEPHVKQAGSLSMPLGMLERALYTGALIMGSWELIAAWLVLKTAGKWKEVAVHRGADNVWLIGNGLSLFFGFFGAWIALGRLPMTR